MEEGDKKEGTLGTCLGHILGGILDTFGTFLNLKSY